MGGLTDVDEAIAAAHRSDWARIVAGLIRRTGDWTLAEDATQDAFATALVRWPHDGIPDRPAAWLTTTARNRAIDRLRSTRSEQSTLRELSIRTRAGGNRGRRRRSAAPDLHVLPPGTAARHPRGADPAHGRRPPGRRDRAGVPRVGDHDGAAAGAGAPQDRSRRHPVPGSARRVAGGTAERGSGRALPGLQRRLQRRRLHRCGRVGGLARRGRRRPHAARVRSSRAAGAHADPDGRGATRGSTPTANCSRSRNRTGRSGTGPTSTVAARCWRRRASEARTSSRP